MHSLHRRIMAPTTSFTISRMRDKWRTRSIETRRPLKEGCIHNKCRAAGTTYAPRLTISICLIWWLSLIL